jgi:hypothetical protein
MFGQLLPNKNKIATVWPDTYYANFASKVWNLNKALIPTKYIVIKILLLISHYFNILMAKQIYKDHLKKAHWMFRREFCTMEARNLKFTLPAAFPTHDLAEEFTIRPLPPG